MAGGEMEARLETRRAWLGGLSLGQLGRQTWREMGRDEVLGRSAQLAYFFFFAIFPLAIFLTSLLGVAAGPNSQMVHSLAEHITEAMPAAARPLVTRVIHKSLSGSGAGKMAFGIVVALLSASSGMAAMIETLNTVFEVKRQRSLARQRMVALGLTMAVGALICAAIFLIAAGGEVAGAAAGGVFYRVWQIAQYPVAIGFLLVAFSTVYSYGPNRKHPRWKWATPGAMAGVALWAAASFGLRVYLRHCNTYTSDYGTAGAVMVLLLWFYLTGLAFLIGGEMDAAIERAAAGRERAGSVESGRQRA